MKNTEIMAWRIELGQLNYTTRFRREKESVVLLWMPLELERCISRCDDVANVTYQRNCIDLYR